MARITELAAEPTYRIELTREEAKQLATALRDTTYFISNVLLLNLRQYSIFPEKKP